MSSCYVPGAIPGVGSWRTQGGEGPEGTQMSLSNCADTELEGANVTQTRSFCTGGAKTQSTWGAWGRKHREGS